MKEIKLSPKQNAMLRHAVGADTDMPGYRNRYCTEVKDLDAIKLVSVGLMDGPKYTDGSVGEGYGLFFVTEKGFNYLGIEEKP